jgi:hypothetical protein
VTVTESAGVETEGLGVELIIEERDEETTVFEERKNTTRGNFTEIRDEALIVDFDVGQLNANNYNYFVTALADNAITDFESGGFVVGEPPFFDVTIENTNSPVSSGDTLRVDARIENTGGLTGTQTITLDVNGQRDSQEVELAGGENRTITLEWTTANNAHNNSPYTATVSSDDDSDSVAVEVTNQGTLSVDTLSASGIDTSSATLNGELTELGSANSANVSFQYRKDGTSTWTDTPSQTLTTTDTFSQAISGLDSDTTYEFRAVADSTEGDAFGDTLTFRTDGEGPQPDLEFASRQTDSPNSEVLFSVDNNGSGDARIEGISIDETGDNQADLVRRDDGNEFERRDGSGGRNGPISIDGTRRDLDTAVTIEAGSQADFFLGQFRQSRNGNTRNIQNNDVTITFYLDDGSQEQLVLEAP